MMLFNKWSQLPIHRRNELAKVFGITKVGTTHVMDNRIVSDGFNFADVEKAMTVEKIKEYTGENEDNFDLLWLKLIAKLDAGELPEAPIEQPKEVQESNAKPEKIKVVKEKKAEKALKTTTKKTGAKPKKRA